VKVIAKVAVLLAIAIALYACNAALDGRVSQASPSVEPSAAEASAPPEPTLTPRPSSSPRPTAPPYIAPDEPGDPLPDELIGAWYERPGRLDSAAWAWFIRGGDAYCVQIMHTRQDCHVFLREGDVANVRSEGAIVTMVDGVVTMKLIRGSCHEQTATYTYTIVDDVLTMTNIPTCFTDSYRFLRAGTNGAPEAPPPPTP
jgi:hypothetical protein